MTRPPIPEIEARIRRGGIVAIVRGAFTTPQVLAAGEALATAGLAAMEVTLNSPDALAHITALHKQLGGRLLIGAGTVRTPADVDKALAAGAEFLIAPGFDAATVAKSHALGVSILPGVFTATEAGVAAAAGCKMLKLFPAEALGPAYLKSLRAPLSDLQFVPTGGVTVENIGTWRKAGAVAVAAGSQLISGPDQSPDDLLARAKAMKAGWEAAGG